MIRYDAATERQALETCEAEPIKTPDRIQPHGYMIVSDMALGPITHVSANLSDVLGRPAKEVLGAALGQLLAPLDAHRLRNVLSLSTITSQPEYLGVFSLSGKSLQVVAHVSGEAVILELMSKLDGAVMPEMGLDRLRWLMARQTPAASFKVAVKQMVRDLHRIVGFDRVMAYRFRPDGSGEVIAEQCVPEMDSFLGLRFPAQDIPQIARAICLEQSIRVIGDTALDDVPLLAAKAGLAPLDLTRAELRGTSSVHTAYLGNMGVGASLVLPIIVENALWGLFSCHHRSPRVLGFEETAIYALVGQTLNVSISTLLQRDRAAAVAQCSTLASGLVGEVGAAPERFFDKSSWEAFAPNVLSHLHSDGMLIECEGRANSFGLCPTPEALEQIAARMTPSTTPGLSSNGALLKGADATDQIAGALRIQLSEVQGAALWLFRREENQVVQWAGAPDKEIEVTDAGTRLTPRSSFQAYTQASAGGSKAWEPEELQIAKALQIALGRVVDLMFERSANEERLGLIVQELNHRVRNILAMIQAIVSQTSHDNPDVQDFSQTLGQRILALSSAHDLLEVAGNTGLDLAKIVSTETAPFGERVTQASGPAIIMAPTTTTLLALVIHEMVTNASKYGALSVPRGRLAVQWQIEGEALAFHWKETGGPTVQAPQKAGFGSFLIEQGVQHQLSGKTETLWHPEGVEIKFWIPLGELLSKGVAGIDLDAKETASAQAPVPFAQGRSVLVLEDNFLIAADIRNFLHEQGVQDVRLAENNEKAIELIAQDPPDCALLDLNLGQEDSRQTAQYLQDTNIPFLFLTGYSKSYDWVVRFPASPFVNKPIRQQALETALKQILDGTS